MSFSETLKFLLQDKNLRQADLCRLTGIQTSLMSDYLGGKKSPTLGNAILIADALVISLDALVGKEPCPLPENAAESPILPELEEAVKRLSEEEQRYLLDVIRAMKLHLCPAK